jgi:Leucine-rich repeat (LRR) protein
MSFIERAFIILVFLFSLSCQRPPDLPPFVITATVLDNSTSVRLDWPLVEDSRIGSVRYDLYLDNKLIASNLNAITYTINNLNYNTTYNGRLVGKTLTGDTESSDYSFTTGKEYIAIPDEGLEQALIAGGFDTEGLANGKMIKVDALLVKKLKANNRNIANLEGVQHFINLEIVDVSNNQISQINLGQNLKLNELNIGNNLVTNLNLSPNTSLRFLYVFKNNLNQLNITQNTILEVVVADYNKLASIDISRNTILNSLGLGNNLLTQINLSTNSRLTDLDLSNNPITGLSLSGNSLLLSLTCQSCKLNSIGVGNLSSLNYLDVSKNTISSVSLTNNVALKTLNLSNNNLNALNLKNNPNLSILNTENNNNLSQICVLNVTLAQANEDWVKDIFTTYSSNCN